MAVIAYSKQQPFKSEQLRVGLEKHRGLFEFPLTVPGLTHTNRARRENEEEKNLHVGAKQSKYSCSSQS